MCTKIKNKLLESVLHLDRLPCYEAVHVCDWPVP